VEKRAVLAFALSILIILFYPYFLKRISKPADLSQAVTQRVAPEKVREEISPKISSGTAFESPDNLFEKTGAKSIRKEIFSYEDLSYKASFTNIGGAITWLCLKAFDNGKAGGNILIQEGDAVGGFSLRTLSRGSWEENSFVLEEKIRNQVKLIQEAAEPLRIRKTFTFFPEKYAFLLEITAENTTAEKQTLECELTVPLYIGDAKNQERPNLEADYFRGEQREVKNADKLRKHGFLKEGPLDWVALEKKYFAIIVKAELPLEHVRSLCDEKEMVHFLKPQSVTIEPQGRVTQKYFVYAGPKSYEVLKSFDMGYERILHTNVLGGLWLYFLILLKLLYKVCHNYGVAIILLSSLIKLIFTPLTHMSFESMRKMQALQPKIKALQEQYKKDPQKLNQEIMQLYKKNKVNPFGGCLPLLLQMPIFIALYSTFSQAIELRGAPFVGWIKDLSEPDQLFLLPYHLPVIGNQVNVLPLIMIGTMLWQQKLTPQTAATKDQEMMMLLMPLIFGFIFYGLPSGLVIYWIVNNLLTIFHQLFIKKLHIAPAN